MQSTDSVHHEARGRADGTSRAVPLAAQREHDRFTAVMRDHEVQVCYLEQLLADALADPVLRAELTCATPDRAVLV